MRVTMYTQVGTEPGQGALWGHKRPCTGRGWVLWRLRSHTQGLRTALCRPGLRHPDSKQPFGTLGSHGHPAPHQRATSASSQA